MRVRAREGKLKVEGRKRNKKGIAWTSHSIRKTSTLRKYVYMDLVWYTYLLAVERILGWVEFSLYFSLCVSSAYKVELAFLPSLTVSI